MSQEHNLDEKKTVKMHETQVESLHNYLRNMTKNMKNQEKH